MAEGTRGPAGEPSHDVSGVEPPTLRDYVAWHEAYRDPNSALSARLRQVRQAIAEFYDRTPGPVRVLSVCSGQGDDILGVLDGRADLVARTVGALVELHPTNCAIARERIERLGAQLVVVQADAAVSDVYAGLVPANLLLLSGIMGNISAADIERLVRFAPRLCAPGATVLWTRGAQEPDLGDDISRWFVEAGFEELARHDRIEGTRMRLGVERLVADPLPFEPGVTLFTFVR